MTEDRPDSESIRNVVVAVDLTPRSELVIRAARRVVADREVKIVVLHVVSDLESLLGVYASGSPVEPLQSDIQERATRRLETLRAEMLADYPHATTELRKGPVWGEIVASAIASRADLVFMGSHHNDQQVHRLVGDLVAKITKLAPCPVVVVPSEEI